MGAVLDDGVVMMSPFEWCEFRIIFYGQSHDGLQWRTGRNYFFMVMDR